MDNTRENHLYPLTLPQRTIYYDYLLYQNNNKYYMGGAQILNGELDIELLQKAYDFITDKFEIFRNRFVINEGELFQTFSRENDPGTLEYIDFRTRVHPFENAMEFIFSEIAKPVILENVALHRRKLLQTGKKQFIIFPTFHHISNDAYGHSIIDNAFSETYNCLITKGTYPDIQTYSYLDFLEDDLNYRESSYYKSSTVFWQDKLSPLPEPMDFTLKKYGLKNPSLHTERITLNLHRMCYASILKIADEFGVSVFQTILGILFTTLYKIYGKRDMVIGMPVLNRSNHKFRNTPGMFMNMIPVRLHLENVWTFSDILNAIKLDVKESYRHQRLPLSETFKHFRNNPEFRNELFDVTIIYRKMDFSQAFGSAKIKTVTLDTQLRTESLSLEIDEYDDEDNVNLFFNYNPLVFSEQQIMQLAKCFETVLFELIYAPEKKIAEIKILNPFEEHRIIKKFNQNGEVKKTRHTIVSRFEEIVTEHPQKEAVIDQGISINYLALNQASNRVANCLANTYNIKKSDVVCLATSRSSSAISAMIGIMKAGAAYLPVDNHLPHERINFILKNSEAKLLITDNPEYSPVAGNILMLEAAGCCREDHFNSGVEQDDLAYIIYTSGSTGTPKGVMIEHGSFMNMFVNMIENYDVSEKDRVLHFASMGFDASVFEIFQALLTGGTLVIADRETIRDPGNFVEFMNNQKISVATLPPAYLNTLDKPDFPFLHTLITAGDQAVLSDVNHYRKFKRYINGYGPTEASVCASWFIADKNTEYLHALPIGKTVPGSSIYILNEQLEPLPAGFSGELFISGPSLARGYLKNETLTAQKFIPDPFIQGQRMYSTGDKARFLEDGNIEFLGRIDEQVKIKGSRIEPGEIENRLMLHGQVKKAVVLDLEQNGSRELAAFIVSDGQADTAALKTFLLEFLPEYMVPQHFIFVTEFPLTVNGKINKNELRKKISTGIQSTEENFSVPTGLESKLIPIFEAVLNYSPVKINDNFFALGGESLKTARLITRIKKELELDIHFKTIFDHPTVRGVARQLESSSHHIEEEIETVPDQKLYPLSHAQQRLWILTQDKKNAMVYNMPVSLVLEGNLEVSRFERALTHIVERHEVLRTIFTEINGTPYQRILSEPTGFFTFQDFSKEKNSRTKAAEWLNQEAMTSFDLTRQIPVRVCLAQISLKKYLFLMVIHHIAGDGLSIGIISDELSKLYNISQTESPKDILKPLRIQYKDYCRYEEKLVDSDRYRKEKEYWLKTLSGPVPVLNLPTDRNRPAIKTYKGKFLFYELEPSLIGRLKKLGKEQNVSTFMILLTAFHTLLYKYTGDEEIITGTPVAGRNHRELENQVGLYLNTVPLRNKIENHQTFIQFLQAVKRNVSEAFSNSNYPFDRLIRDLDLERDTSRAPLFDVFLQYQPDDVTNLNLDGITSVFFPVEFSICKFDLTFTFTEAHDKINFCIGFNIHLFKEERIVKLANHFLTFLYTVLKNPGLILRDTEITDLSEKLLLRKFSHGPEIHPDAETVTEIFKKQVIATPYHPALAFNNTQLTYRQLNSRANTIACEIHKYHKTPDQVTAILMPRSELTVIAMLGILKAGSAYMPLDQELPAERIKFMLSDSRCKLLLTVKSLIKKAEQISGGDLSVIDISELQETTDVMPEVEIAPSSLAYVIYTSGSTGTPKGVMIEHHSICNLVAGLDDAIYHNPPPLSMALVSPFGFDASVKQIFYALLNGHCLHIVPDETRLSGKKLLEFYQSHQIEVTDGTPVHLEILLDELQPGIPAFLPQRFIIGGQQLLWPHVKKLFEFVGDNPLIISNVYGPTECCDVTACFNITREMARGNSFGFDAVPIGKPLGNVQAFILDSTLRMVPVGVNGEICIAGVGLARGYVNLPEMNREKFVHPDFLSGKRIYRSGDLGRFLDDGNILLTGRSDDQVKLRGFRIELNEIEMCLLNYPAISSAAVVLTGEGNGQELAAYCTVTAKTGINELREFLSCTLPEYMIPAYFTFMEKLPLTSHGKVDKKALPVPEKNSTESVDVSFSSDNLEVRLGEIWKELLQINQLGREDNFFRLGGHSLTAIRMGSRIHREFNVEIGIWEIFQHATIASLVRLLKTRNASLFKPVPKVKKRPFYPLSHAQRRLWVLSKLDGQNALYNLPAVLLLKGNLNVHVFEQAWDAIIQRHESLRTCFVEIDGEPFQKIEDQFHFNIQLETYSGAAWDKQTLNDIAAAWFEKTFDLSCVPLMEIKLVRMTEDTHLFLFNMHHIIGDGWSIEIMLKELVFFYHVFLNQNETAIEPLRINYKDYAIWQNNLLEEQSLVSIKNYWLKKLQKPRPLLNLPADFTRTENLPVDGNLLHFRLGRKITGSLEQLGSRNNASMFMTLLSAVYILLYKYTGEEDLLVGSPVAGRQHFDLENQIGFYINTLVLRNRIDPENTCQEFLRQVIQMMNEALDNQIYPFDLLVDELDVERLQNRNPLFDVMVAWMVKNGMEMNFELDGVQAQGIEFPITRSMFDLTFLFEESHNEIIFSIEYNKALFRQDRIERMAGHFRVLIENILANPEEKIRNLTILPEPEKEQLLKQSDSSLNALPTENHVIGLFSEQAAAHPGNTALIYNDQKISYSELDRQTDKIAGLLAEKADAGREDIIVVMTDDPVWSVMGILSVMKTGAACLPVSPDTPAERMAYILRDSRAKAVLADGSPLLPENETVVLDLRKENPENPHFEKREIAMDSLAYVIYTSGSTGTPKGVLIEHAALANLMGSLKHHIYSPYTNPLNELMISSFVFDVSIKQVFASLCTGNTLHVLHKDKRLDPREVSDYIIHHKINITDITPSVFSVMMEEGFGEASKPWLKELFLGSEPLPKKLVRSFYLNPANHSIHLTNFYGPTECCVESSFFRLDPGCEEDTGIAPIGRPVMNEQIYILDRYLNLCPAGVPGEICIGGAGLARGYLNDPDKSREKFVRFPLTGTRIYKTGDLGLVRPNGIIEFLGRMDEQVKIRGYRVELPEIENRLALWEEISECSVVLSDKTGNAELLAYFTARKPIDPALLKNHLERFLPDYMIPSCFIQLEKIPLTENGKIDKNALPAPSLRVKKEGLRTPVDETEATVIRICAEVLKKDNIGPDDHFFNLGGNSLMAVRFISRIQKELGTILTLKEIFYHPVLADLAGIIRKKAAEKNSADIFKPVNTLVPASDDELRKLSELQFDDEED